MDIKNIELYQAQIKSYEVMMQNCNAPNDILWYKSQIEYLKGKIKELGD